MMDKLTEVLVKEDKALKNLLVLLDEQFKLIMSKNVFGMEEMVERLQTCNKGIAEFEVERRKLIGNKSMREIVKTIDNDNLDNLYRKIQKLLEEIILQKDTNETLIKQQLGYVNKMLNIINPRRDVKTYNSYGNLRK
ncbi:flagellar protein FlgN [Clostridium gasigenes]|uniref:flagellar protein FlgN n=1 Tax=Clostridium gasigenes TaxID=94869 RepID=UPI001C0B4F04|nr:flagellar protein FlgN [Clostridium gasigenes]MBU3136001.1 flagellar protein FlgN [Clostridium gasigenes]